MVGAIAIALAFAILFLSNGVTGLFDSSSAPLQQAPFTPPHATPTVVWPTTVDDCEDDGWRDYPQFLDEDECLEYVDSLTP